MTTTAPENEQLETGFGGVDELFSLTEADLSELRTALQSVTPTAKPGSGRKTQMVAQYTR